MRSNTGFHLIERWVGPGIALLGIAGFSCSDDGHECRHSNSLGIYLPRDPVAYDVGPVLNARHPTGFDGSHPRVF